MSQESVGFSSVAGSASNGKASSKLPVNVWRALALALAAFVLLDKFGPVLRDGILGSGAGAVPAVAEVGEPRPDAEEQAEALRLLTQASNTAPAPLPHGDSSHDNSSYGSNHSNGSHGGGHEQHQQHHVGHSYEALYFLLLTILVGTFVMHLGTLPYFKGMQQTVVLFVLGCVTSFIMSGMDFKEHSGPVGRSYDMWMNIDPHLLLFTLLPPLLAGDAMTIDMVVARKVALQCLYLAGPGVLINSLGTAFFLYVYLPYNWSFFLCLSTGAILCATDPVAVVALLKELGASPTLTVQIQGESLLNDGTAIVMFNVAYAMLQGQEYNFGAITAYLVKMAVYAWLLGLAIGGFFLLWIMAAKKKLDHASSTIQVLLTLACAYTSFIVAEGIFHISGVLCTVSASLLLAEDVWAEVVCHETMHTVWHMLENLGNTIIFFLAGALTGNIMVHIGWKDWGHLLLIYLVLVILRFSLILLSRPFLKYLVDDRRPVAVADAVVMGWGGLRGAVGLALGIQVSRDRAGGAIDVLNAERVLFYVGGVALLTLLINAVTCPWLVKWLEITKTPRTKRMLMNKLYQQLADEFLLDEAEGKENVKKVLDVMLQELKHHIGYEAVKLHPGIAHPGQNKAPVKSLVRRTLGGGTVAPSRLSEDVMQEFLTERQRFEQRTPEYLREHVKSMMPQNDALHHIDTMRELLRTQKIDAALQRAVNEAFLALVRSCYWHQVENNEITSVEFKLLVSSVAVSLSDNCYELSDFRILEKAITKNDTKDIIIDTESMAMQKSISRRSSHTANPSEAPAVQAVKQVGRLQRTCESVGFRMIMFLAIIANSIIILIEEYRPATRRTTEDTILFIVEVFFVSTFTVECLMALGYLKLRYFWDSWNVFDFTLVIGGWVGIALEIADWGAGEATDSGAEEKLAQTARIFRVLRSTRLFRLLITFRRVVLSVKKSKESEDIARHIRKFILYSTFVRAHTHAQNELIRFLGRHGKPDQVEIAHCIMQSLTDCYKAMVRCSAEDGDEIQWMLEEREVCQQSIEAMAKMEEVVTEARDGGIISPSEAAALVHTMHSHWSHFERRIEDLRQGRCKEPLFLFESEDEEHDAAHTPPQQDDRLRNSLIGAAEEAARASQIKARTFMSDFEPQPAENQYCHADELSQASPQVIGMKLGKPAGKAQKKPKIHKAPEEARAPVMLSGKGNIDTE